MITEFINYLSFVTLKTDIMSGIEWGKYLRQAPCKSNVVSELLHIKFDTNSNKSFMEFSNSS